MLNLLFFFYFFLHICCCCRLIFHFQKRQVYVCLWLEMFINTNSSQLPSKYENKKKEIRNYTKKECKAVRQYSAIHYIIMHLVSHLYLMKEKLLKKGLVYVLFDAFFFFYLFFLITYSLPIVVAVNFLSYFQLCHLLTRSAIKYFKYQS